METQRHPGIGKCCLSGLSACHIKHKECYMQPMMVQKKFGNMLHFTYVPTLGSDYIISSLKRPGMLPVVLQKKLRNKLVLAYATVLCSVYAISSI